MKSKDNKSGVGKIPEKTKRKINPVILVVSLGLALVLIFGVSLVSIGLIKEANAVVSYNGVYVSRGVASYLASTYKYDHIRLLNQSFTDDTVVDDNPFFWAREDTEGVTYGDGLKRATENYIRGVVIGSYLFDSVSSLSSEEREYIDRSIAEVLDYKAGGNTSIFNEECASMGFTFEDFKVATEMMYKASMLKSVLYGPQGSYLKGGADPEGTEEFLSSYSHVKLLFIRLHDDYVLGEDGKPTFDGPNYAMRELTDEEYQARMSDINHIREMIQGYENDGDMQMSPESFALYQEKYLPFDEYIRTGYYFAPTASYTVAFAEEVSYVLVERIFEMEINSYLEVTHGNVTAFVYKYAPEPYAYTNSELSVFFGDFFPDCSSYLYTKLLEANKDKVNVKDAYYEIDLIALPYNYKFIAG